MANRISGEQFWGLVGDASFPSGPFRADADPSTPYQNLPFGQDVWTEERLGETLGADMGPFGIAARTLQFGGGTVPLYQTLSNVTTDVLHGRDADWGKNFREALDVFSGVGHKDPETGVITGQAQWAPGHGDLGMKAAQLLQPGDTQALIENAIPGGVLLKLLPDDLRALPPAVLEPILKTGLTFAGNLLEDPTALAAMGGSGLIRGLVSGKSALLKGAYLTSELAQKVAGGYFVSQGAVNEAKLASDAWKKGDQEAATRHASQAIANIALGAVIGLGARGP
jgi:hypothetical protein